MSCFAIAILSVLYTLIGVRVGWLLKRAKERDMQGDCGAGNKIAACVFGAVWPLTLVFEGIAVGLIGDPGILAHKENP